jgi:hypothetical protein
MRIVEFRLALCCSEGRLTHVMSCLNVPRMLCIILRPSHALRSFHRLSDGLRTLVLVDQNGLLVDVIDIQKWSEPFLDLPFPVPSPSRYEAHSRATICGGHVCLILTSTGEMKIFADGVQVFRFLDGRWRITDAVAKYAAWKDGLRNAQLADTLFVIALNLAEDRRGGLPRCS